MIPKTNHLQQVTPRLHEALNRLRAMIWEVGNTRLPLLGAAPTDEHTTFADRPRELAPVNEYPQHWGRMFQQRWFEIEAGPDEFRCAPYLFCSDEGEATVYADGRPIGGFDPGHRFVKVPAEFSELHIESICCRTGIWVTGETQGISDNGSRLMGAYSATRNDEAWQAYFDYEVLYNLLGAQHNRSGGDAQQLLRIDKYREPLHRVDPLVRILIHELDAAVDLLDREGPAAVSAHLRPVYERLQGGSPTMNLTFTGHSHIDLVWLWPERVGVAKAIHSFANVLALMDDYPDFQFGYSQPASYRAVEARCPQIMDMVNERIGEGRWEAVGAMEVESDTNMACGEALLRSLQIGQQEFTRINGRPSEVLWLPDVFGYSACLPKLMLETGVRFFFTTKVSWSGYTRFPLTSFRWRGIDGSEVVSHVMLSGAPNGYNSAVELDTLNEHAEIHKQANVHAESLVPIGYGDGGGGPSAMMCERVKRVQDIHGLPKSGWGRIDEFFARMDGLRERLPHWRGEIYVENHRGVLTTHVDLKQAFRGLERSLQALEAARACSGGPVIDAHYWRRLVFSQFHDYIPGSSIMEVYEEGLPELISLSEQASAQCVEELSSEGGTACLFNPLPVARHVLVEQGGVSARLALPPLSGRAIACAEPLSASEYVCGDAFTLENGLTKAVFTEEGTIAALSFFGNPVAVREPLGQMLLMPDHPAHLDAWEIDRNALAQSVRPMSVSLEPAAHVEGGVAKIVFRLSLTAKSSARVTYTLHPQEALLRLDYEIDWRDEQMLLKTTFATDYRGRMARYGSGFGSTLRPQCSTEVQDDAMFEVPASRWALVADDNEAEGLALITADRYGFGCWDGMLHCSLVRSAFITDADKNRNLRSLRYNHLYSDLGQHSFSMALVPGGINAPREQQPACLADTLFTKCLAYTGGEIAAGLLSIDGAETLVPMWAKPANDADGWMLRLHETRGLRGVATLKLESGWEAWISNADECLKQQLVDGAFHYKPYCLISIKVKPV